MKHTLLKSTLVALLMTGWLGTSQAASVTLSPDATSITVGQTVTFNYNMDFTDDSTLGGGTDFWYDPSVLEFVGWSFDTGLTEDNPFFRRDPTDCQAANSDAGCGFDSNQGATDFSSVATAQLNGLAWGQDSGSGMAGPATIGQMVFLAVGEGNTTVYMAANDDGVAANPGPFVSGNSFTVMDVTFNHGSVNVSNVPVPAAVWFMLSGLGMLGGFRRFG